MGEYPGYGRGRSAVLKGRSQRPCPKGLSVDPASPDHARAMFIDGQFTGENDEHLDPSMLGIAGRPLVNLRYFPRLTVGQRGKPAVNEHVMSIMKNAKITDA
jgi:hypothetical protein